jgi:hypothetical protein
MGIGKGMSVGMRMLKCRGEVLYGKDEMDCANICLSAFGWSCARAWKRGVGVHTLMRIHRASM